MQTAGEVVLRIVPVLDVLNGVTVHAVRGRRREYKPLRSVLCGSSEPLEVAVTFRDLGFSELYIADLDAITGRRDNFAVIEQIAEKTGLRLIADAGVSDIEKARRLMRCGASNVVVGTETLTNINFVEEVVRSQGPDHVTVSLDMKNRMVLGKFQCEKLMDPADLLFEFQKMGVAEVIVLDLARVGSEEGVDSAFLSEVLGKMDLRVLAGGGVRNVNDLIELKKMGVSGVLLATALHTGKITVDDLARLV